MSVIATALKHMLAAGMAHDAIVSAVAELEAVQPKDEQAERRRAKDRERKALRNSAESAEVVESVELVPPSPAPSPRPPTPPTPTPGISTTRAKAVRSRRVPEAWLPSPSVLAVGQAEGFTPGEIERELAQFRDHEFRDPHSDWDASARKWLRNAAKHRPLTRQTHERSNAQPTPRDDRIGRMLAGAVAAIDRA